MSPSPTPSIDEDAVERQNITTLLRWVGAFAAWPGLTIAFVFLLDLEDHQGHFTLALLAGLAGVAVLVMAPRIARRFYPEP